MFPIKDDQPRYSTPYVNGALIAVNILVYAYQWSLGPRMGEAFARQYGVVPALLAPLARHSLGDAILPFFTSMFLHAGWTHVLGNMWFLYIFGDNIEDYLGHFKYLIFYLIAGLIAMGTQVAMYPHSHIPTVGASGAIAGVLGAYFVLYPRARVLTAFFLFSFVVPIWFMYPQSRLILIVVVLALCLAVSILNPRARGLTWLLVFVLWIPAWIMLGYWFVLQFLSGAESLSVAHAGRDVGGVAVWAHVGGFVVGMVMIKIFPERGRRTPYAYR